MAANAELPWTYWCVWVRRDFEFTFSFFPFERTRPPANMDFFFSLIYRSNWDEAGPRERLGRNCFLPIGQSSVFIPGCIRIWSHGLVNLSVRLCMCNLRGLHSLRERFETEFHTPGIYGSGRVWVNAWDVFRHTPYRCCRGCRAAVDLLVCLGAAGFRVYLFDFFPSNAYGLLQA